jgi:hypothetical protein
MKRNTTRILIYCILFCIVLVFVILIKSINFNKVHLSESEKLAISNYYFRAYSGDTGGLLPNITFLKFKYQKMFIKVFLNGSRLCSYESLEYPNLKNNLSEEILEAIRTCSKIKERRKDMNNVILVFEFLYNKQRVLFYYKNIKIGLSGISIINGRKSAYFSASTPIENRYQNIELLLGMLCKKANLEKGCYKNLMTQVYTYESLSFKSSLNKTPINLYRDRVLLDISTIDNQKIYSSIALAKSWYLNNINKTGFLEYMYYPSSDIYYLNKNHVRVLASIWALSELRLFFRNDSFDFSINKTLNYYLGLSKEKLNFTYININKDTKLAYNAFLILALINFEKFPKRDELLRKLANGILSTQENDGSFNSYFESDADTGQDYYPGEAMLALMKLYRITKEERYLKSIEKAFLYYRQYWRNKKNSALIPWHTMTYLLLYNETKDPELIRFIFEMNDWLIPHYQITKSDYPDEIGGLPRNEPKCSTSSYLEGLNDAYLAARIVQDKKHVEKYGKAIRIGTRFILQTQFTEEDIFYVRNKNRSLGGFSQSLTDNYIRIDFVQHALFALMKTYENKIFGN